MCNLNEKLTLINNIFTLIISIFTLTEMITYSKKNDNRSILKLY